MMFRLYLRLSVLLILTFTGCSFVLMSLGSTQPIHPALRGFVEGCEGVPQPCWYGIVPGVTTVENARVLLESQGLEAYPPPDDLIFHSTRDVCRMDLNPAEGLVRSLTLAFCTNPSTGDVFGILGAQPEMLAVNCHGGLRIALRHTLIYTTGFGIYSETWNMQLAQEFNDPAGVAWRGFGIYFETGMTLC